MSFRLYKLINGINSNDTVSIKDIELWLHEKGVLGKVLRNKNDLFRCLRIIEHIGFKINDCLTKKGPFYEFSGTMPFKKVSLKLREASWRSVQSELMRSYTLKTYCPSIGGECPRGIRKNQRHHAYVDIKNTFSRYNLNFLYHFTDKKNLKSIKREEGIFSKKYISEEDFSIKKSPSTKGSKIRDTKRSLYDYVYLSYVPIHPMMLAAVRDGRIEEPVILRIDKGQAFREGTLFSSGNSDSPYTSIRFKLNKHRRYAYDIISNVAKKQEMGKKAYEYKRGNDKYHIIQSEVLVRRAIPKESILNLSNPITPNTEQKYY